MVIIKSLVVRMYLWFVYYTTLLVVYILFSLSLSIVCVTFCVQNDLSSVLTKCDDLDLHIQFNSLTIYCETDLSLNP